MGHSLSLGLLPPRVHDRGSKLNPVRELAFALFKREPFRTFPVVPGDVNLTVDLNLNLPGETRGSLLCSDLAAKPQAFNYTAAENTSARCVQRRQLF